MDNLDRFISRFDLPRENFSEPKKFIDAFGFATTKPRNQNGLTFVSIYKFFISREALHQTSQTKPITIAVDYAEKRENGELVLSPTSIPRRYYWPTGLISTDEFFYNIDTGVFYRNGQEIDPKKILKNTENAHLLPTRPGGYLYVLKIFIWFVIIVNFLKGLHYFVRWVGHWLFGRNYRKSIWLITDRKDSYSWQKDEEPELEPFAKEKLKFFEYQASAWAVVTYSLIHLLIYLLFFYYLSRPTVLKNIILIPFLTIIYVIPSIAFYERSMPKILDFISKKLALAFQKSAFKQFRIEI